MLIHVVFADNRYDYVKDFILDELIEAQKVARFRRSSGWVTIGKDPIRDRTNKLPFNGIERRSSVVSLYPFNLELGRH